MRIYMDTCCWLRLTDKSTDIRIWVEAMAISEIIDLSKERKWTILASTTLDIEISKPEITNAEAQYNYYKNTNERLSLTKEVKSRARWYQHYGIDWSDSFHLATAQEHSADIFLTTDDKLLELGRYAQQKLPMPTRIENPAHWIMEARHGN
jgi:predicted nucleic acid-binding protein